MIHFIVKIFLRIRKSESWRFEISSMYRRASSMMNKHASYSFLAVGCACIQPEGEIRFSVDVPALYSFAAVYNAVVSYPCNPSHLCIS